MGGIRRDLLPIREDPVVPHVALGHERGPRGHAQRTLARDPREPNACASQCVERRRQDARIAGAPHHVRPVLVRHDKQDVGGTVTHERAFPVSDVRARARRGDHRMDGSEGLLVLAVAGPALTEPLSSFRAGSPGLRRTSPPARRPSPAGERPSKRIRWSAGTGSPSRSSGGGSSSATVGRPAKDSTGRASECSPRAD